MHNCANLKGPWLPQGAEDEGILGIDTKEQFPLGEWFERSLPDVGDQNLWNLIKQMTYISAEGIKEKWFYDL